ncbi:MAG: hypothetical protein N2201_03215 [candidate division WOR-3 bacterium]|nr:hypothetical protein [candidate division WOR-3 bacterium]
MKVRFPLFLVLITGILGALPFLIPHSIAQNFDNEFRNSVLRIIGAFSLVLGVGSIVRHHLYKIQRRRENWEYSYILLISLVISAIIGLFGGIDGRGWLPTKIAKFSFDIQTIYTYIVIPLGATMFAMLSFFMASAAYRAFRARTFEATLLLIAAFIMMLGSVPLSSYIIPKLPSFAEWILTVPNTAAKRGMGFGISLGTLATSLKIILGIERGWLGGTK